MFTYMFFYRRKLQFGRHRKLKSQSQCRKSESYTQCPKFWELERTIHAHTHKFEMNNFELEFEQHNC